MNPPENPLLPRNETSEIYFKAFKEIEFITEFPKMQSASMWKETRVPTNARHVRSAV